MDFVYCNRFFSSFVIFLCLFAYSIRIAECANNYVSKKPTRSKSQIQAAPRNDTCIWYGQCAIVEGSPKNCLYNGPPKPFNNPDADTLFKQLCPSMLSPDGSVPNTCCDTAQLNNFKDSSAVALSLLERCPSCLRNFMTLFCESTCSPIQSQFMYPASVHIGNATSPSYIEAIGVIFDTHYMDKVFNSCKEVQNPSSNGIAMDILCGQSVSSCTPQAWLDFMATQAPLTINYTIATGTVYNASGSTFDPLDTKAYSCAEAPDLASSACSCSDCTPQCPVPVPPPPPASPCVILGVDCAWAICIFIFCGLSTLFIAFLGHQWLSQNAGSSTSSLRKDSPTRSLDDVDYVMALGGSVSKFEEAGARFDDILQKLFYRWGSFCARNPIIVLLATVVLLVACCLGWLFFSVTTDPVQLWSSPYSRARTEKNFFDSHFGRFYRVEQIIIRPKDQRPVFNPLGFNCSVDPNCLNPASNFTYGPIFRKEFLQEVFGIEHHLLHLVTNSSVSLDKICLKPLEPQNQNCAVMSVSQYFQGDVANLDIVAMDVDDITSLSTYIDHIMSCATNPISVMSSRVAIPCLGAAGAPSNPWVVFGGFEGDQYARADVYANATALIITFPVKNPLDPTKTAEAMEWEDAAIAYLKDYKQENVTFTFMFEVFGIEHHLLHLVTNSSVSLDKICLKPLEPQNQNCAVMSVSQYFQGDVANLDIVAMDVDDITSLSTYIDHIMSCATNPISVMSSRVAIPCLGAAGAPSNPWVVFGGFEGDQYARADVYANATALIITFPVKNPLDPTKTAEAMEWEDAAIAYLKDYKQENVTFTFMFERSIEDEIRRESNADVFTVISSYVVMFIYITLTLGQYGNWKRCLIDSKITLGLAGVLIVFASFGASVGLFSYVGFPATLIIIEVIPFLVLAVGVDNIFILVQTYQRDTRDSKESVEDQVARVVGKVGPSILLTSLSETCCFFIDIGVSQVVDGEVEEPLNPTVEASQSKKLRHSWNSFEDLKLLIQYRADLQSFTGKEADMWKEIHESLVKAGIDVRRNSKFEEIGFLLHWSTTEVKQQGALSTMPAVKIFSLYAALAVFIDFLLQISCFVSLMTLDIKRQESSRLDFLCFIKGPRKAVDNSPGLLYRLVSRYYSPFITHKVVRAVVLLTFTGWLLSSVAVINKISVGFDQKNSMPEKSYVLDYMKDMEEYLAVGAPVYFVVEEGLNYSVPADQNHICSRAGCDSDSLLQQIYAAARSPEYTKIAQPAGSWLDDYLSWLAPGQQKPCCQVFKNDTTLFCPSSQTDREALCQSCNASFAQQRPVEQDFMKFLPFFLIDNPGVDCPKGGHAAYASGVEVIRNRSVGASHFMTYHTVCKTSSEFTEALVQAHKVADNVSQTLGVRVFPYSVFYVYYEQYLTVVKETVENLSFSLVAIFAVTFILLGLDWYSAIVVVGTIAMIEIDLMAVMHWWGIELNAISLVNLVMGVGISVEFCSHLVRAFAVSVQGGRIGRAQDAVTHMGSSVLSGITLTKFGGILILGFSHSQIFKVYYFRMYLSIVLIGAAHGLIFLPVLLTYIGPPVNKKRLRDHREHMFSGDHRVGTPSGHDEITGEGFENPVV